MRKPTGVLTVVLVVLVAAAGPAAAQKDPFDPVIDPNAATVSTTTGTTTTTTETTTVPAGTGSDSLAETGADVTPWLAIAYTLFLIGGGALVISRMRRPEVPLR